MIGRACSLALAGCITIHAPLLAQGAAVPAAAQDHPGLAPARIDLPETLPVGTPVAVALTEDVTSSTAKVGDRFRVILLDDVAGPGGTMIPKGTPGYGEVTFSAGRGGFGRVGMLSIALRHLDLNGRKIALDGRYREEGKAREGAVTATMFAIGAIGAGFIKGGASVIPRGRVLKARLGEAVALAPVAPGQVAQTPATATAIAVQTNDNH